MKAAAWLLFALPLTACFDLDRLFPARDLGEHDQGAGYDASGYDASIADSEDAAPSLACTAHLHDGVWSPVSYGPGGAASGGVTSVWAAPENQTVVEAYLGSYVIAPDGQNWGPTLTPTMGGLSIWGTDAEHLYYLAPPDTTGSTDMATPPGGAYDDLFEIDLSGAGSLDLSSGAGLASDLGQTGQQSNVYASIVGRHGTSTLLFSGCDDMYTNCGTSVWNGTTFTALSLAPGPVAGLAGGGSKFFRSGYRYLESSVDGVTWDQLYDPTDMNSDLYAGIVAAFTPRLSSLTPPVIIDATFGPIWAGQLPTGEDMMVVTLTSVSGSLSTQLVCWKRGTAATQCEALPLVTPTVPWPVWGTTCGVILVVGPNFQALRYDLASDRFLLETKTPSVEGTDVTFVGVTGHDDGTAIAFTDRGYLYVRN